MRTRPSNACGRKIHGPRTTGVVSAPGLGRVRYNWANGNKQSHNDDFNWYDPVCTGFVLLFTLHGIVNVQPDSPTSPLSIMKTFQTNELMYCDFYQ